MKWQKVDLGKKGHELLFIIVVLIFFSCQEIPSSEGITIVVNEVVTSNSGADSIVDKDNNYSDWVELYNWGDKPVSLSDLFITDKREQQKKTPLPPVLLEPGGFCLLWGGSSKVAPFEHLGFKLSENDDGVFIYSSSGELIDGVSFGSYVSRKDTSYARFPDGALHWIYSSQPSPLKNNVGK